MFEYIRRGITRRKRQSAIILVGMALAVMAVLVLSSASAGIVAAQHAALSSVYGVGTDITVTKTASNTNRGGNFQFGPGGTRDSSGSTKVSSTQVRVAQGTETLNTQALTKVKASSGVSAATGTLALSQTKFSGNIQQGQSSENSSGAARPTGAPQQGGGFGGGNFDLQQTSLLGVQPEATSVGPTTNFTVKSGRLLKKTDTAQAVISSTYAKQKKISTGSTLTLGESTKVTVVGVLSNSSSQSASDVYLPLATAQKLVGQTGAITTIYVKASDAGNVTTVAKTLSKQLSGDTVSTQSELAGTISGSLASASSWVVGFGRWLTVGILALAFLLAVLFTLSSITRRTRELGTLKAIGWSNARVLGNVAAETLIQTVVGGLIGVVLGCAVVFGINAAKISLSSSSAPSFSSSQQRSGAQPGNAPGGQAGQGSRSLPSAPAGERGRGGISTASSTKTVLELSPSASGIGLGLGMSVLGGLVAAGVGSIKVSRLRPAAAMRSVD